MDRNIMKNILFPGSLNKRVLKVQSNEEEIDPLIHEYKPFILATARKCAYKSYITEQDDEYSIALIAFAEAVRAYREDKGNFLSFAKSIIKMRFIDYYRKEKRHFVASPLEGAGEENPESGLTYQESIKIYAQNETAQNRALEIEQFSEELQKWGISFSDLVHVSPKHKKTREVSRKIIAYLMGDEEKLRYIFQKKMLPLADIEKNTLIPRKQLERLRKYIIAVLIIKNGDYPFLNDYVKDWGRGK